MIIRELLAIFLIEGIKRDTSVESKEWANYDSQGNEPYRHIDTIDEAKKIAKLHSCNIYDLDSMKKLIAYP